MIGFRGALRYTRGARGVPARAGGDQPRLGRRAHEPPRDAAVRPHGATSSPAAATWSREAGLLDRPGFELWVMAEVPSVLFNLERYARLGIAGISIGSNDLTQLLLGADRDSELLAETFDERDPAVTDYLSELIPRARAARAADLDLRPGAVGPPRVRRAAGPRRDRRDLGDHRRGRPHAPAGRRGRAARCCSKRLGRSRKTS